MKLSCHVIKFICLCANKYKIPVSNTNTNTNLNRWNESARMFSETFCFLFPCFVLFGFSPFFSHFRVCVLIIDVAIFVHARMTNNPIINKLPHLIPMHSWRKSILVEMRWYIFSWWKFYGNCSKKLSTANETNWGQFLTTRFTPKGEVCT
jgi:hypothetical protein